MVRAGDGFELSLAVPGRALRAHAACADMLAPVSPSSLRGAFAFNGCALEQPSTLRKDV